ncbi:MAG: ABC-three component system protein [Solirubrobacteraceae bacterium]
MTSSGSHSAGFSALGYLYQSQWPLIDLLRRAFDEPDASVTLELHDDVAWEVDGTPTELLQVKHHVTTTRGLSDKDDDLWRTIRAWLDARRSDDPSPPALVLVTTATTADGSAAEQLRPGDGHDPEGARVLLETAARESTAAGTKDVRERFLGLSEPDRRAFVARIRVLDGQPVIGEDLDAELRRLLYYVLPKDHETTFVEQLWGWWHGVVVALLRRTRGTVRALDVKAKIDDLRNSFAGDNLPTLVQRDDIDFDVEQTYANRNFVEQLRWIAFTAKLLQKAMIDYYRAYTQSALWLEDNLVALDELERFEADLKDEWERQFEYMTLKLSTDTDDAAREEAGRELFRLVTERSNVRLRAYDEPFFTHGKFHELAEDGRVGWHPDFQARLQALLLGGTS